MGIGAEEPRRPVAWTAADGSGGGRGGKAQALVARRPVLARRSAL